jgi:hypothetical protein
LQHWRLTVVSRADVAAYSAAIDDLSTVAFAQVKALLESLSNPSPVAFRDALLRTYPELMRPYMGAAADISAQWYSALRIRAGVPGSYMPVKPLMPPVEQFDALVRYSLKPLFTPTGETASATVFDLIGPATQKLIANQGRDTISGSAFGDPVRTGYARIPRSGCCSFCALLASRGAVYRSAASAGGVVGRGVDAAVTAGKVGGQGQGVKIRGSQDVGKKFHNLCRCVVVPAFPSGDNSLITDTRNKYTDLYRQTGGVVKNKDGYMVTDLNATLASWREEHGAK